MANQHRRNNNQLLKEQCLQYLGGKRCRACDVDWLPLICYDFHHNKDAKEEAISKMIQRKTKMDDELKKELDKCVVVCANCHRQINTRLVTLQ